MGEDAAGLGLVFDGSSHVRMTRDRNRERSDQVLPPYLDEPTVVFVPRRRGDACLHQFATSIVYRQDQFHAYFPFSVAPMVAGASETINPEVLHGAG